MEERTERVERTPPPGLPPGGERPRRIAPAKPKPPARRRGAVVADPIADLLLRIKNAQQSRHDSAAMPASKLRAELARILKGEGFIAGYDVSGQTLTVRLKYAGGKVPALAGAERVSRSGRRVYSGRRTLPRVRRGLGVAILTTSQGVMTGAEAAKRGLGGEILCTVW